MIKPVHDKILLEEIKNNENEKNDLGIITSVNNEEKKNSQRLIKCKVIDVSDGFIDENGNERTIDERIAVGSTVIIDKYSGSTISEEGNSYILAKQIEVLAIIK